MKTLLILRHGHAAPESQAASDHERELTPRGVGEVKRSVAQLLDIGTMPTLILSSTAVRALIRQFIDAEDKKKPLSDSQLAGMLEEQGIQCARRTVAKYREGMKIATAPLRKSA